MGKISIKNYKKYIQSIHIQLIFCMLICRYPKKSRQRSHKMKIHFMAFFVFERRVNAMDEKKDVEFTQQAVPLSQRKGF